MEQPEEKAVDSKIYPTPSGAANGRDYDVAEGQGVNPLARALKGRHMQMIAIGIL
jgi:amino acid permease